jgi:hypothetical protein
MRGHSRQRMAAAGPEKFGSAPVLDRLHIFGLVA